MVKIKERRGVIVTIGISFYLHLMARTTNGVTPRAMKPLADTAAHIKNQQDDRMVQPDFLVKPPLNLMGSLTILQTSQGYLMTGDES